MNISKMISMIQKELKESDVTEKEKDLQASIESQVSPFKAKKTKKDDKKLNDKKNKSKDKDDEEEEEEVDEADPADVFTQQVTKSKNKDVSSEEEDEEDEDPSKKPEKKTKQFSLARAKSYENFIDLINNFRAAGSVNGNDHVKGYFSKLTLGEKQAFITLIDGLTKACNGDKTTDYDIPKSPTQLGIKIEPKLSTDQEHRNIIKAAGNGDKAAEKKMSTLQPITVGESKKINNYSIDKLLKEVK